MAAPTPARAGGRWPRGSLRGQTRLAALHLQVHQAGDRHHPRPVVPPLLPIRHRQTVINA